MFKILNLLILLCISFNALSQVTDKGVQINSIELKVTYGGGCTESLAIQQATALGYTVISPIALGVFEVTKADKTAAIIALNNKIDLAVAPIAEIQADYDAIATVVNADFATASCVKMNHINSAPSKDFYNANTLPGTETTDMKCALNMTAADVNAGTPSINNPKLFLSENQGYVNSNFDATSMTGMVINDEEPFNSPTPADDGNLYTPSLPYQIANHTSFVADSALQINGTTIYSVPYSSSGTNNMTKAQAYQFAANYNTGDNFNVLNSSEGYMPFARQANGYADTSIEDSLFSTGRLFTVKAETNGSKTWQRLIEPPSPNDPNILLVGMKYNRHGINNDIYERRNACSSLTFDNAVDVIVDYDKCGVATKGMVNGYDFTSTSQSSGLVADAVATLHNMFPTVGNYDLMASIINATKIKNNTYKKDSCDGWGAFDYQAVKEYLKRKVILKDIGQTLTWHPYDQNKISFILDTSTPDYVYGNHNTNALLAWKEGCLNQGSSPTSIGTNIYACYSNNSGSTYTPVTTYYVQYYYNSQIKMTISAYPDGKLPFPQ